MTYEPRNAHTGRAYSGKNIEILTSAARKMEVLSDPRWMTFMQAKGLGLKVKKGEHGTRILYCVGTGEESADPTEKKSLVRRCYVVFHASQVEGLKEDEEEQNA